ncbi:MULTISPECIES: hypothetical protein [Amycolatopsis]|uniref:Uncharacterized protein n=1 Tax=Amycolatopsis saalfeldensis TaxID=394193 RepID=A0A1H8YNV4_9PSEU|nr:MULTISPECIES: hypothetical protein [Amycolatopsis]SEP53681.1 hypothetical protein SAMN04489732_129127 [Amycolatopsis saalfeldensis]
MGMKELAKKAAKKAAKKVVQKSVTEPAKKAATKTATKVSRGVASATKPQVVKSTIAGVGPCAGCNKPFDGRSHNKPACSRAAARPMARIHEL